MIISFYLTVAVLVMAYVILKFIRMNIRQDEFVSTIRDDEFRVYLIENPIQLKWTIFVFVTMMGMGWPITIFTSIRSFFETIRNIRGNQY